MKLTLKEWNELCKRTGIKDNGKQEQDDQKKKQTDFQILMNVWAEQDRLWMIDYREAQAKKKQAQREQARQAQQGRHRATRNPAPHPMSFGFGNGPAKPLRFATEPVFAIPEKLNRMGQEYLERFRWIE